MRRYILAGLAGLAAACASPAKPPTTGIMTVASISPSALSTTGGATVTVSGTGFGTDTTLTIGGTAVSGATVTATGITGIAPPHAAGSSTAIITSGGKSATVNVTFVAPSGVNAAPVISNLRINGPGNKPPSPFVDLATNVTLSATVTDVETSPSSLTYAWTVAAGTVTGTGASVTWNLPASLAVTPAAVAATLTVSETFSENGVQHRNTVTASFLADAHDSETEISDKGFRFLDLFSRSSVAPAAVMSDFEPTCSGTEEELGQTITNRQVYLYQSYTITRMPPVGFVLGGLCVNPKASHRGDACSQYTVHWVARVLRDYAGDGVLAGQIATTDGTDYIANVFRSGQWRLCDSTFQGSTSLAPGTSAARSTLVMPTPKGLAPGRIKVP